MDRSSEPSDTEISRSSANDDDGSTGNDRVSRKQRVTRVQRRDRTYRTVVKGKSDIIIIFYAPIFSYVYFFIFESRALRRRVVTRVGFAISFRNDVHCVRAYAACTCANLNAGLLRVYDSREIVHTLTRVVDGVFIVIASGRLSSVDSVVSDRRSVSFLVGNDGSQ